MGNNYYSTAIFSLVGSSLLRRLPTSATGNLLLLTDCGQYPAYCSATAALLLPRRHQLVQVNYLSKNSTGTIVQAPLYFPFAPPILLCEGERAEPPFHHRPSSPACKRLCSSIISRKHDAAEKLLSGVTDQQLHKVLRSEFDYRTPTSRTRLTGARNRGIEAFKIKIKSASIRSRRFFAHPSFVCNWRVVVCLSEFPVSFFIIMLL